ncbi:AzlC family ABC transporter permease [Delftia tsuruhatensis]|uniref:AzlC family ABC transporter permease n=1 Tax=Delftia tsuruhatensis TaxID=180282 RepID=UPI00289FCDE7|nr:AzlC family ABC transporter permease [Delftia tsuruhatensis]
MSGARPLAAGLTASLSVATGYLPIAFSFGVAAVQAGLAPSIAVMASVLVYAGASQFLLISLLASGTGLWTALPTVLLMNARHVLYGPALQVVLGPRQRLATPWLAFGLTDEVFATAMSKMQRVPEAEREHWLLGLQLGAYAAWVGGTVMGVTLVGEVDRWPAAVREGLAFVLPALFFALLLEAGVLRWWRAVLTAAVVAAVLACFIPGYHALALAILCGALAHAATADRG